MASRIDPITEELLKRVTWDWQDLEPIIQELIPMVAPGKALRSYDQNYESFARAKQGVNPNLARPLTDAEKQSSGARNIVNSRISSMRDSGRVETDGQKGDRRIRFRERRETERSEQIPTQPQDRGGSMFGGKGEQALRVADALTGTWVEYKREIDRWKSEMIDQLVEVRTELSEARNKQRDYARTVQGQVEAVNERLSVLATSNTEVLESQVNELRDQVNILREAVRDVAKDTAETSQAMRRLVGGLAGAVTPKSVFGENLAPH